MRPPPTLDTLPPEAREWLYWLGTVLAEVGGLAGAITTTIAYSSPDIALPMWVPIVTSVLLILSGRLHSMAKNNTPKSVSR